ncbi:MAG: hypothetical protein Tp172MES00d2C118482111_15 [Prokaryotic dsDNA virus sp.]|nr:MAG: hypothetical protein Tp172MES00d2C118482111_15 [Prokaryotic dsDNA virus sp.]
MLVSKYMKRQDIIYELAKYAHPSWYHDLLKWRTWQLDLLLQFYQHDTGATKIVLMPARRAGVMTVYKAYARKSL